MPDENNRIITHEWAKSNSNFYTNPDINFPDKKGLTHLTVKNSIPDQMYKIFTFKNYPLNRLVTKNNFKFNFIYPDYGQGFNYKPTHVTINEHPDYFRITVGGQFTMYRKISLSENCNRIININSNGTYDTYNWGGEISLGFFGNFDTNNYSIPTIIDLETIYDGNTPYNIVSGTFTNYKYKNSYNNVISTNVSRVCAINSGNGNLCSYYNTLPTYTNNTYKIKQIEDFSKPTRVLGVSYYKNTDHILTDFTIVPNTSYQPTLKSTQKALVGVDRSIIKAAYLPDFSPDRTNYDAYFCGSFRIANGNSTCKYFTKINFYTGEMTSGNINLDTSYYNIIQDFDIQSDGKIVIIGDFKYNGFIYCMLRLNLDLSVDTSFTGLLTSSLNVSRGVDARSSNIKVNTIAIQRLGQDKDRILIGGCFSIDISNQAGGYYNQCGYAYFDKNGAIVPAWGRTSQSNTTVGFWDDSESSVERIKLLPQGDFILVGLFDEFDGIDKSGICNLRYNGTINYDSTDIYTDVPN